LVPCVILGDSLAVGIGQYRPECETVAQTGITSARYVQTMLRDYSGNVAVISLGVNDGDDANTLANLRLLRGRVRAQRVYWLLPGIKPRIRELMRQVAVEFNDFLVDTRFEAGADHLHPSRDGYKFLAGILP
jgi:lysophospholipase L1-like esterase